MRFAGSIEPGSGSGASTGHLGGEGARFAAVFSPAFEDFPDFEVPALVGLDGLLFEAGGVLVVVSCAARSAPWPARTAAPIISARLTARTPDWCARRVRQWRFESFVISMLGLLAAFSTSRTVQSPTGSNACPGSRVTIHSTDRSRPRRRFYRSSF